MDQLFFEPESMTRQLHSDPLMAVAGLRALLLQALHPVAMAGVAQNSSYREDGWGRLEATGSYVRRTTFSTTSEAQAIAARVRKIHSCITGTEAVSGRVYRADDEDLLLWIHCALVDSIWDVLSRARDLPDSDGDRYLAEQVRAARLIGVETLDVPASLSELDAYMQAMRPVLRCTPEARSAAAFIVKPPMHPAVVVLTPARLGWAAMAALAYASLPEFARRAYAAPGPRRPDVLVRSGVSMTLRTMGAATHPVRGGLLPRYRAVAVPA